AGLQERAQSTLIELRDLVDEISTEQDSVETDESRAEKVRERLNVLYQLFKKHAVSSVGALLSLQAELQQKVSKVENMDEEMAAAEQAATEARAKTMHSAELLSETRRAVLPDIESEIGALLHDLGMPNASLRINPETGKPSATGIDTVTFMFSANKGIKPQQLKNVASGGEFSRLMLAIKYILASKRSLPTIIFDEIDTGVSGEIAIRMGNMMKDMAHNHQIIAITHLPQIAAQGTRHYFVYKDHSADRTVSRIRQLSFDERVTEIAQMIGGKNPSANTVKNAREILKQGKLAVAK
ncbi:MAG: DNA repair protein RecN, partial [Rudanella sp.]|nr:DNA repair protein RecN [Rudanella sp.]